MGKKSKVRFYVRVRANEEAPAHNALLVSVRQLSSGDLIVVAKANRFMEFLELPENIPLLEHRYTVHVSPNSSGNTLTNTFLMEGGPEIIRNVSFVACDGQPLITVLFSYRWPTLSHEHFRMNAKANDTLHKIADFSDFHNTLITHVIVTSKGEAAQISRLTGGSSHSFSHFDILVVPTFINVLPIEQGDAAFYLSSSTQIGDNKGHSQIEALQTLLPSAVPTELSKLSATLRDKMAGRIIKIVAHDPEALKIVLSRRDGVLSLGESAFNDPPASRRQFQG